MSVRYQWHVKLVLLFVAILVLSSPFYAQDPPPFTFVAIGDTGCDCDGQEEIAKRLIAWHKEKPFRTVIMLGDNIYAGSWRLRGGNRLLFQEHFDDYYQPLLNQGVKFYATLGNHDLETNKGRDLIRDKQRFNVLGPHGYYDFIPDVPELNKNLISFYCLNSTRLVEDLEDPPQIDWLKTSLKQNTTIWKIAYFHHPIYTPLGRHEADVSFRQRVEKVLQDGGVQIAIAGHNHFYARMKELNGIIHFISGGGGRSLSAPKEDATTEITRREHHFLYFEVYPDKIDFWAVPSQGSPIDQGTIQRKSPDPLLGKAAK